jgi:hypothetical protein
MTILNETVITFSVDGGIFGVSRLATILKNLEHADQIGPWHIGKWIDYTHAAIRIRFSTAADGELAKRAFAV